MEKLNFKQFKIGDSKGYYVNSNQLSDLLEVDNKIFNQEVNKLCLKDRPELSQVYKNDVYLSQFGFELTIALFPYIYGLKWKNIYGQYIEKNSKKSYKLIKKDSKHNLDKKIKPKVHYFYKTKHFSIEDINKVLGINLKNDDKIIRNMNRKYKYEGKNDKYGTPLELYINKKGLDYLTDHLETYSVEGYCYLRTLY